jgi:protocadherin Fat 1/2/3
MAIRVLDNAQQSRSAEFISDRFEFAINETSPVWTHVGFLRLKNVSAGAEYFIAPHEHSNERLPFTVNRHTGMIAVGELLDYERQTEYSFVGTVKSMDGTSSTCNVRVDVLDANDNTPRFGVDQPTDVVLTGEQLAVTEMPIASVRAVDQDSGNNGHISYRLANVEPVPFIIDAWTGDIRVSRPVQVGKAWTLRVRAADWGVPLRREAEVHL